MSHTSICSAISSASSTSIPRLRTVLSSFARGRIRSVAADPRDGNFYGTTGSGGAHLGGDLEGTAFKLTPAGVLTTLYSFGPLNSNPSNPFGGLVEGNDGAFYGITAYSGASAGRGTVFKLVPP
jgi:uncharacterized repeat protein (TIGR03803 family)